MALSFIQCSHWHKILIFLSYYIHCYVCQLVCQYDDIPLASLIYCKRTFFPMCRMSGFVNTLLYFYFALVCLFRQKKYTSIFLSWNSYPSASRVIFSSYGNLAKLLNYRQLCIDCFYFWCLTPLSTIFQLPYIMGTSFSGGGSRSTRREPSTMGKQLVNFITCGCESSAPFL